MPFTMQMHEVEDFRIFVEYMKEKMDREKREEALRKLREIAGAVAATP